jgi:hypothetical protein
LLAAGISDRKVKKSPPGNPGGFSVQDISRLSFDHIGRLVSLRTLGYLKLHGLPLIERLKAVTLDGGKMNKHISAALLGDEPLAFAGVEPFHSTFFHSIFSSFPENLQYKPWTYREYLQE